MTIGVSPAIATNKPGHWNRTTPKPGPAYYDQQKRIQNQNQTTENVINSTGGTSSAESGGNSITAMNNHQFLSLSLMFPQAAGCFKGFQGGGAEGRGSNSMAFLGFHILDHNCWMDKLANQERDIEIMARLKCGSKKYRNAVSFDVVKKDRQYDCVARVIRSNQALIEHEKMEIERLIKDQTFQLTNVIDGRSKRLEKKVAQCKPKHKRVAATVKKKDKNCD